jgi:hypothetical protein
MLVFHTKIVMAFLLQCVATGVWKQGADGENEGSVGLQQQSYVAGSFLLILVSDG